MSNKICSDCKIDKPLIEYRKRKASKDGLNIYCKPCHTKRVKEWRLNNPELKKAQGKRETHRLKQEMLNAYGNACACCGEDTPEFLSIDHINNDGAEHRKQISGKRTAAGVSVYRWLRKQGFPKDNFQLLCYNCNSAKQYFKGCPHSKFKLKVVGQ